MQPHLRQLSLLVPAVLDTAGRRAYLRHRKRTSDGHVQERRHRRRYRQVRRCRCRTKPDPFEKLGMRRDRRKRNVLESINWVFRLRH